MSKKIQHTMQLLASSEAGFVFAVMGTLSQTAHTWFIALEFSSFTGIIAVVQAATLSIFLSGGLLFYIVRTGVAEKTIDKIKYNSIANAFVYLEVFINLFYWLQRLVFIPWFVENNVGAVMWYKLAIAIPFAILVPVILKTYGGEIRIEKPVDSLKSTEIEDKILSLESRVQNFRKFDSGELTMKVLKVDDIDKVYTVTFKPEQYDNHEHN